MAESLLLGLTGITSLAGAQIKEGQGDESPEFEVGDANANYLPRFCHVSKFQAPKYRSELTKNTPLQAKILAPSPDPYPWKG